MDHLNESSISGIEFEKEGKHYYIVSKEEMRSNNLNIIGMMTGVDVLTGGDYENGGYIGDVSDENCNALAKFVMEYNLEGVFDYGVSNWYDLLYGEGVWDNGTVLHKVFRFVEDKVNGSGGIIVKCESFFV